MTIFRQLSAGLYRGVRFHIVNVEEILKNLIEQLL